MTQHHRKVEMVELGPGLKFPAEGVAPPPYTIGDYDVTVKVVPLPQEGRLVVQSITIEQTDGGPPVDAAALRSIPVAQLLRDAAREALDKETRHVDEVAVALHAEPDDVRRRGPSDDHALRVAAVIFARAHAVGNEPTKAVVDVLGMDRTTAVRWINRARERGFLSEAQRSRRGHVER